ncbi:MAG TPA: carboxypeptidase-like regulatory domain-containing protein, partial [Gemmataceae bacterium]|nr:carboxypeptidase-like regulatory domain-containing protein [Gemmataceae bacterium]
GERVLIPTETGRAFSGRAVPVYRDGFTFGVTPSRPVFGQITDGDSGRPMPDILVWSAKPSSGDSRIPPRAKTNAEGWYRLDGLSNKHRELTVEPVAGTPYFAVTRSGAPFRTEKEPKRVDFRLTRAEWLTGRVVEARTNKAVAGARVEYYPDQENNSPAATLPQPAADGWQVIRGPRSESLSGPDGRFRLLAAPGRGWVVVKNLSRTSYLNADQRYVQGEKPDRKPLRALPVRFSSVYSGDYSAIAVVNLDPDRNAELSITLETGAWPEVRFVDPDGKVLSGVVSRRDPTFNPEAPPPILTAFHPDRKLGIGYRPKAGDLGPWTVQLQPPTTVTARLVRKNGEAIANDDVYVNPSRTYGAPLSPKDWKFRTDKDGWVRLTDIIVGAEYDLWCAGLAEKIWDKRHRPFAAKPGAVTDLGTIVGGQPRD